MNEYLKFEHLRPTCPATPLFVDLFSGIGGASQGASDAGFATHLAVDSCPRAMETYPAASNAVRARARQTVRRAAGSCASVAF